MALPFFYLPTYDPTAAEFTLDEDNYRHIVQVLRMQPGEALQLTDGKGALLTAVITDDNKKKCRVRIQTATFQPPAKKKVTLAISLLKNASRFEWFLEKATEIGVSSIIPLVCERTEKQHARPDRLRGILISAMLQSQQAWLPELPDPVPLAAFLSAAAADQRFIAHCLEFPGPRTSSPDTAEGLVQTLRVHLGSLASLTPDETPSRLILIGPEGDFSPKEVEAALKDGFIPVTLGDNRLRTETAGIVAATLLCIG